MQQTELIFGLGIPVAIGAAAALPLLRAREKPALWTIPAAVFVAAGLALWGAGSSFSFPPQGVTDRVWIVLTAAFLCAAGIQVLRSRASDSGAADSTETKSGVGREGVIVSVLLMLHLLIAIEPLTVSAPSMGPIFLQAILFFSSFLLAWVTTRPLICFPIGDASLGSAGKFERLVRSAAPPLIVIAVAGTGSLIALFSGTISLSVVGGTIPSVLGPAFAVALLRGPLPFPTGFAVLLWPVVAAIFTECALYAEIPVASMFLYLLAPLALGGLRPHSPFSRFVIQHVLFAILMLSALGLSAREYLNAASGY